MCSSDLLPKVTEGERARAFPLGPPDSGAGVAVVLEAAFLDARQSALWNLIFAFRSKDLRVPPQVFFVPGARAPIAARTVFESTTAGLKYTLTLDGLAGGPRVRSMIWRGDRFVDARPDAAPGGR